MYDSVEAVDSSKQTYTMIKFTSASQLIDYQAHVNLPNWNKDYMNRYYNKYFKYWIGNMVLISPQWLIDWEWASVKVFDDNGKVTH